MAYSLLLHSSLFFPALQVVVRRELEFIDVLNLVKFVFSSGGLLGVPNSTV